jgi:lysozyme family protein
MDFTDDVRDEYRRLFKTAKVRPQRRPLVEQSVKALVANKKRYKKAGDPVDVPWWIVAVLHELEASRNFKLHLHNGDPLTRKTVHVPAGRPPGNPPFTWEESATDAMTFDNMAHKTDWSMSHALYRLERFNGFGYRPRHLNSPYLWSFSQHYTKGKFDQDGHFDPGLVSQQCGAAVLLRVMVDEGHVEPQSTSGEVVVQA